MAMRQLISILLTFTTFIATIPHSVHSADWTYLDQGLWPAASSSCSGMQQSPINIERIKTHQNLSLAIELINYDISHGGYNVINNNHSVQFNYIGDLASTPILTGSAVEGGRYKLAQFHAHWGSRKGEGSEHTIDGKAFSLEQHFVHYNEKYASLTDALSKPDGVTVLGVFYQIDREPNLKLEDVVHSVQDASTNNDVRHLKYGIRLIDLMPKNLNNFYRYPGSLTTPPCTEKINWLVLDTPARIGLDQIEVYRDVQNLKESSRLVNNFRNLQAQRTRLVEASFDVASSALSISGSSSLIVSTLFVIVLSHFVGRSH